MTKKKRRRLCIAAMLALGIVLLLPVRTVQAYEKKTIYNSPYVSFSPDGKGMDYLCRRERISLV